MRKLPPAPQEALDRLIGTANADHEPMPEQHPFAAVLACVDSRVAPEIVFRDDAGKLIVARVPGNYLAPSALAALEYAVSELGVALVFVLGHTDCAAMRAAVELVRDGTRPAGEMLRVARSLARAAKRTGHRKGDWTDNAAEESARMVLRDLSRSRTVRAAIRNEAAGLAGGIYDVRKGELRVL